MKKTKVLIALLLSVLLTLSLVFTACVEDVEYQEVDVNDAYVSGDFNSVWNVYGDYIEIENVTEKSNGLATATFTYNSQSKTVDLGMDFLSMAMVYKAETEEDYNFWWKLYIQRWNYLMPEIPLYSNQYYDVYNKQIIDIPAGTETNPYWSVDRALVNWTSSTGQIIIGDITDLGGQSYFPAFGKSSQNAADAAINRLIVGYEIVTATYDGIYQVNTAVVEEFETIYNGDGSVTFEIEIKEGLKMSDGSAITAKNYVASVLVQTTPVAAAAGGSGTGGKGIMGWNKFYKYDGTTASGTTKEFSGVKLDNSNPNKFSLTVDPDFVSYYANTFASISPRDLTQLFGAGMDVVDDGDGCYITGDFYASTTSGTTKTYTYAATLATKIKASSGYATSGAYYISNYNSSSQLVTLKINQQYAGDDKGYTYATSGGGHNAGDVKLTVPSIETVMYKVLVSGTETDELKASGTASGGVDILCGITGKTETDAALALVSQNSTKFAYTKYDRAGYGKLALRGDFGPTMYTEVRQAVAYTMDSANFIEAYAGSYATQIYGPYYTGSATFKAVADSIVLETYEYSFSKAKQLFVSAGFVYNVKGKEFKEGTDKVRYVKLEGKYLTAENILYSSIDGAYKTVKINGEYFMPLVINWCRTENEVADNLILYWMTPINNSNIGLVVQVTVSDFNTAVYGEFYHMTKYGWSGSWVYNAFNFATGYTSAEYDYSWNWTIDEEDYENEQIYFIRDDADFVWLD